MTQASPPYSLKRKIAYGLLALLLLVLIGLRLYFSTWLLQYVNNVLSHIQGYQGSVASIDIDLYRGAYRLNKLILNKEDGHIPTPFIAIDKTDFSIEWSSLLHGRIVASTILTNPVINFAVKDSSQQTGEGVDWTKPIKDLMPIDINYVQLNNGSIAYQDFSSSPNVNIYIHHLNGIIRNLRNVQNAGEALPSSISINGSSIGNGKLRLDGGLNILKPTPDMDLQLSLENVDLPAVNNYSEAYASFDFKTGNLSLYTQFQIKDGDVTGYVKPLVTDLSVDVFKSPNPIQVTWSSIVSALLNIFTNLSKDQFATRVDLEGKLGDISANFWSALEGMLHNAFIKAMDKGFDKTDDQPIQQPKTNDQ